MDERLLGSFDELVARRGTAANRSEAVRDLRNSLALDPRMKVLVMHGLTDLVTPYFESKMVLDQIPDFGTPDRLRLVNNDDRHLAALVDRDLRAADLW